MIDAATERLAGGGRALAVTTTTSLASLWLAPRLPRFTRAHPGVDVRIAAVNDMVNLNVEREHLDVAIRFMPPGGDVPNGERLVDYKTFPVCAPGLVRERGRQLKAPADLAHHVLLDFERIAFGRRWSDWERWFDAMQLRPVKPAGMLRFSHYDQAIQAAIEGSGVTVGKWPHLARHLADGALRAPLGPDGMANLGSFYVVVAPGSAEREPVSAFVRWLKEEARQDGEPVPAPARGAQRSPRRPLKPR